MEPNEPSGMPTKEVSPANEPAPLSADEKNWGMYCHLAVFAGFVIPFGNVIGPLILWSMKKDEYAFADYNGKEALNFQLTMLIIFIGCFILSFIFIGLFLMMGFGLFSLIVTVLAIIKSSSGEYYRYPFKIQFVK
tara:strand:- start:1201 stop:1605 length:405 start_codon:yes stop_codon:yes gene_type:complete